MTSDAMDPAVVALIREVAVGLGVVLPKDFDPIAVIQDGVRKHGWSWSCPTYGYPSLYGPGGLWWGDVEQDGDGTFMAHPRADVDSVVGLPTVEAACEALWVLAEGDGTMPPVSLV